MQTRPFQSAPPIALSTNVRVLLARAGYLESDADELSRDSQAVSEALRRLQRDRGLDVTGELDPGTAAALDRPFCGTASGGGLLEFARTPFPCTSCSGCRRSTSRLRDCATTPFSRSTVATASA